MKPRYAMEVANKPNQRDTNSHENMDVHELSNQPSTPNDKKQPILKPKYTMEKTNEPKNCDTDCHDNKDVHGQTQPSTSNDKKLSIFTPIYTMEATTEPKSRDTDSDNKDIHKQSKSSASKNQKQPQISVNNEAVDENNIKNTGSREDPDEERRKRVQDSLSIYYSRRTQEKATENPTASGSKDSESISVIESTSIEKNKRLMWKKELDDQLEKITHETSFDFTSAASKMSEQFYPLQFSSNQCRLRWSELDAIEMSAASRVKLQKNNRSFILTQCGKQADFEELEKQIVSQRSTILSPPKDLPSTYQYSDEESDDTLLKWTQQGLNRKNIVSPLSSL